MVRDFSEEAKRELEDMIRQLDDEKLCDFTDWIGDRWYDFEEWLGRLDVQKYISNIRAYHRKVLDKNNATILNLEKIFQDVYQVEDAYSQKLKGSIGSLRLFNALLKELSQTILPGNLPFTGEEINHLFSRKFQSYSNLLMAVGQWEAYLELFLEDCRAKGGITEEDKKQYIRIYEEYQKEQTAELNQLLSVLSQEEISEIKFKVYAAEEPYRSIYLTNLTNYTIGNISGSDTGYFTPVRNTINVNMKEEPGNPRGPYTIFFHESGHAIDYNLRDDGTYYSMTYRNGEGKSLQDVIYEDVSRDVERTIRNYVADEECVKRLHSCIMGADKDKIGKLSRSEQQLLKNVQNHYKKILRGAVQEAASDVYGGVTDNIISGSYGHWGETYWYRNGKPTYAQSRELWAEYYSYCITGNKKAQEALAERFPDAKVFLDEMAEAMIK